MQLGILGEMSLREFLGPMVDFFVKLSGEEGQTWWTTFKLFLRKEPCWVGEVGKKTAEMIQKIIGCLKLLSAGDELELDETDGIETLAEANNVFTVSIDGDFQRWGTNVLSKPTSKTKVQVFEVAKDGNFEAIFTGVNPDLDKLCLEQSQIKGFVRKYKKWLRTEGYATLFLFKVGEGDKKQYFVADVRLCSDGPRVFVLRFSSSNVWGAEGQRRVVLPQQTLES